MIGGEGETSERVVKPATVFCTPRSWLSVVVSIMH